MNVFPKSLTTKQAVIATLAYFDLFGIPLTRAEISEYFFFKEPDEEKIDIYLRESPLVRVHDGYYSLQGNETFYLKFYEKIERSKAYWQRIKRFQWLFSLCPFVKLVCVCNSLPIRDVGQNSDIDLFIVTEKGKMFTARFFITLLTHLFRVRRHGRAIEKRFCLSFYVTESAMDLKPIAQEPYDIYLAYWLKTLQPISGDHELYEKMIRQNEDWIKHYFHNRPPYKKRFFRKRGPKQIKWKERLERWFGKAKWEKRFKGWQLKRAHEKAERLADRSGTIISEDILKFHDRDSRSSVRRDWMERLSELL